MTISSYQVKVPGKLLIAGDYAVLESGQKAIVIAVDRYITASIKRSSKFILSLPDFGIELLSGELNGKQGLFRSNDPRLKFIKSAIQVASQFLQEKEMELIPFHLQVHSELSDEKSGRKYGLGSSAAIVVAVILAILQLHSTKMHLLTLEQIFKLAAISHLKTQKNGSGIDIAASTYGGWIEYSAYQPDWVLSKLQMGETIAGLIEKPWPNLTIQSLTVPVGPKFCVGWTGEPASTAPMIEKVKMFQQKHPKVYKDFLQASSHAVEKLKKSLETNNYQGLLHSISENRIALQTLSEQAGITIETPMLGALSDIAEKYGSGKSSGAGGGDCGIAFVKNEVEQERLYKEWFALGIHPLRLSVAKVGAIVMKDNEEHP